jgi:hypothetical protein
MNLVRNLVAGAIGGAIGTAAMDMVWYSRYRRAGGTDSLSSWESASGVSSWDQASAPGQLGRKLLRAVTRQEPSDEWARTTTNLVHWATGIGWGIQYGALASLTSRRPLIRAAALGPSAWLSSYVLLPLAGVYKPIWTYDAMTLAKDLSAHLVYGSTTAGSFAAIAPVRR